MAASFDYLKEPSGIIRLINLILAIIAFGLFCSFSVATTKSQATDNINVVLGAVGGPKIGMGTYGGYFEEGKYTSQFAVCALSTLIFFLIYELISYTCDGVSPTEHYISEIVFLVIIAIFSLVAAICVMIPSDQITEALVFGVFMIIIFILLVVDLVLVILKVV